MTQEQFIYWLKGYMEIAETSSPSHKEWNKIKENLIRVIDGKITGPVPHTMDYLRKRFDIEPRDIFNTGVYQKMMLTETPLGVGDQTPFLGNTTCESNH